EFEEGDQVLLEADHIRTEVDRSRPSRKLRQQYIGPFKIIKKLSKVVYKLKLPPKLKVYPVFHISRLKKFHQSPRKFGRKRDTRPPPIIVDGEKEYEVEKILDKQKIGGEIKYLVKWVGYPLHEASWEPIQNLVNAQRMVKKFEERSKR